MSRRHLRSGSRARLRTAALGGLAVTLLAGTAQLASPASAAPVTPAGAAISGAAAPGSVWRPAPRTSVERSVAGKADRQVRVEPRAFRAWSLDAAGLDGLLADAPAEDARGASADATSIAVPAPNGDLVEFAVVSSPIMADGLAADHPEITTYAGRGVDDPTASIRLDVTPMGFHASVRGPGGTASWYVDPSLNQRADAGADPVYLSYRGTALPTPQRGLIEPDLGPAVARKLERTQPAAPSLGEDPGAAVTTRTFRLALITDPSYSTYFGADNVLAEKVTLMNRVNQIYNDDLAVRLELIDETDELSFDTLAEATQANGACGSNPCYTEDEITQGCDVPLLFANRIALGQIVGASGYDIGHIMLGINGGGIAGLGVVGDQLKGLGCTGLPQPEGDFMAIDYVAHEMGHQMGGPHTFNGTQVNCSGGNRSPESSVEPGSGSSVMAYAGICGTDDLQPHTDPYFSQRTISDITGTVLAERTPLDETQQVSLSGFGTDGFSFRLGFDGEVTEPIVRGENYTSAGIKAALDAIVAPGSVTVDGYGGNAAEPDDTGFEVIFDGGPLSGTDVPLLEVVNPDVSVTGFASETDQGGPQGNQGTPSAAGNNAPVVTVPAPRTIPVQTPFTLTGEGTDPDGDALVYTWEQNDIGSAASGTGLVDQTKTDGPLFRMFSAYAPVTPAGTLQYESPGENLATGDPSRTFPDLDQVLANNTNARTGLCPDAPATGAVPVDTTDCFAEWLPTADYVGAPEAGNTEPSLDFRLTARDLAPAGGGTAYGEVKLTIDPTTGPFLALSKNRAGAAAVGGRTESFVWDVAGTDALAPNVTISLSTDGGQTYPTVLAERVPNDGEQLVTWPDTPTEQGRIRIEAVDNYFFDVTDNDLTILANPSGPSGGQAPQTTVEAGPRGVTLSDDAAFTFGSSVAGSTFACTLDGADTDCADGTLAVTGLDAGTHEVTATAMANGQTDASPAARRWTVPVDDRALRQARGRWSERTNPRSFLRTVSVSTSRKDVLSTRVSGARQILLVADKTRRSGSVSVYLGRSILRTVSLRGPLEQAKVIRIGRAVDGPITGRIRVVAENGRAIRVDGLAVVAAP